MTVVDALILNPKVTQSMALLATTLGRDKVYRLIQYVSRVIAWSAARNGHIDLASRFDALKGALGQARKVMRVFKPVENLQAAVKIAEAPFKGFTGAEHLAQATQFTRQLAYATYLTTDSIIWLQFAKFLRLDKDKMAKIGRISQKAWFYGIVFSLISSTASLVNLRAQSRRFALQADVSRADEKDAAAAEADRRKQGRALLTQRQTIISQLVTDVFDFWIPANNLGYTNLNDGVVGACGAITSYIALQKAWAKHARK
jgi:peroxin-11B